MIGIREGSRPGGLMDGEVCEFMITNIGFAPNYLKALEETYALDAIKADALGSPAPVKPVPSYKSGQLLVDLAVISRGRNTNEPFENVIHYGIGDVKLPPYRCTTMINHLALPEVFNRSEELRKQGRGYGYNFQRNGVTRVQIAASSNKPIIGYLHANPNPEKDWESGIHAYQVSWHDEKWYGLADKERKRLANWEEDIKAWEQLSEEQAKEEMLEGIARRLGIFKVEDNVVRYGPVTPGVIFTTKVKVTEKGYLECMPISAATKDGKNTKVLETRNVKFPKTDDDFDAARDISMAIAAEKMASIARRSEKDNVPEPTVEDETEPF